MKSQKAKRKVSLLAGLLVILIPVCLFAKISPHVNFQGYITDKNGMPVADGQYDIKFSIYNGDSEAASELWNEIQTVNVKNGFYTVSLGSVTAFKDPNKDTDESDALGFSEPYFLGIKVRKEGESEWDEIAFDARYLPLSSVWSAFRSKSTSGRLIAIKDQNAVVSDAEDMLLVVGQTQITLSPALNAAGRMITIKKVDPKGTIVSIITKNGETIDGINYDPNDGADPFELTEKYQEINLISDGRNWISTSGGNSVSSNAGTNLQEGSVSTLLIADQAVTTSKLADHSVTTEKLSLDDHSISPEQIDLEQSITNAEISNNAAIAYTKIQLTGAIDSQALADRSVTSRKLDLSPGDLSYSMINLTGLIINSDISEDANINYSKLDLNNSLTNVDIAENASISHTKIDLTGISAAELLGSATIPYDNMEITERIKNSDISPSAGIAYNKLSLTGSIQTNDLANETVTYQKLNLTNGDIPYVKLSLGQSITNSDIADNASISYNKLDLKDKISTSDLLNGVITQNKIARDAVRTETILDQTISSDDLADSSITANKLKVSQDGTSGQVLTTDGSGGLYWQTPSGTGTSPGDLSTLNVSGLSTLNTVIAQHANITQISISTSFSANQGNIDTLTGNNAIVQSLVIGDTGIKNLAQEPRTLTIPDVSGQLLVSGHPMITAVEIANSAIENRHVGEGAIQNENIASNAQIPYAKLMLHNAIQNDDIANHTITYDKLKLSQQSIPYTLLNLTGSIQPTDIAMGSLNYSAIDFNAAIQSKDIKDFSIQDNDLANNIITPFKLSGIHSQGNLGDSLMSDGSNGFYWQKASPFDDHISEVNYSKTIGANQINTPTGLAVISNGDILMAERESNRVRIIDPEGNIYSGAIGIPFLDAPQGITIDDDDNLYVADSQNNCIKKFGMNTETGDYELTQTIGQNSLSDPFGVAVDSSGNIYVADSGNNNIKVFTSDGNLDYTFGSAGNGTGQFNSPYDIAIDRAGNIFVLDTFNNRVQKFNRNGSHIITFPPNEDLNTPFGITIDDSGYVYVADTLNNRIQIYDNYGNYKLSLYSSDGIFNPKHVAVDRSGLVFVSDSSNDRIQVFKKEYPIYTVQTTGIGINTISPYTATAFQIDSTKGGLLIPRMSYSEKEAIVSPVQGLLVFQTDGHSGFYFYSGTEWVNFDSNIYDETITETQIASDAITGSKIKDNSITGDDIKDQSLSVSKLSISGHPQDGHILVADGDALKWQACDKLTHILTVGDGGQYETISNALAAITDNSNVNRYLIKVGPGTFMEQITLKPFVDIEGSGENQTIILYTGGDTHPYTDSNTATVLGSNDCEIRLLTIVSQSSSGNFAVGVYNNNTSPKFQHVTIQATGANENIAICNANNAFPKIYHSTLTALTGAKATGIENIDANIHVRDSIISCEGSNSAIGILHDGTDNLKSDIEQSQIRAVSQPPKEPELAVQTTSGTIWLIGSRLEGIVSPSAGTASCAGVYGVMSDEIMFYQSGCPQQ